MLYGSVSVCHVSFSLILSSPVLRQTYLFSSLVVSSCHGSCLLLFLLASSFLFPPLIHGSFLHSSSYYLCNNPTFWTPVWGAPFLIPFCWYNCYNFYHYNYFFPLSTPCGPLHCRLHVGLGWASTDIWTLPGATIKTKFSLEYCPNNKFKLINSVQLNSN